MGLIKKLMGNRWGALKHAHPEEREEFAYYSSESKSFISAAIFNLILMFFSYVALHDYIVINDPVLMFIFSFLIGFASIGLVICIGAVIYFEYHSGIVIRRIKERWQ